MFITLPRIRMHQRLVHFGIGIWIAAALIIFLLTLDAHWPLGSWLFPRYAAYILCALVPLVSAALTGTALVEAIVPRSWALPEKWAVGLAVGVFGFQLGWAALGFLRAWSLASFIIWPLLYAGLGYRIVPRLLRNTYAFIQRRRARQRSYSAGEWMLMGAGTIATALVYLPIITPHNLSADARWYHMPIAERYALEGGIIRFPEGWLVGTYPQLVSTLYGWCFTAPGASTFDHIEIAVHLEFLLFLATLASVGVLARRLAPPGVRLPRGAWACLYVFPEIFLYDSSLNGGADHIAAFFAIPLILTLLLTWKRLPAAGIFVFSVLVSSALLTKVTAAGLVVGPALALLCRVCILAVRAQRKRSLSLRWLLPVLAFPLMVALFTTPYWLKNWLWYDNPIFPLAADLFSPRPWNADATARLAQLTGDSWTPTRDLEGVKKTLTQAFLFSFEPSDWATFHRDLPMFGSLFTLFTPLVLFRRTRALLGVTACTLLGVLFWYWTYHQDRYLQAYLPWMVSSFVVLLAIAWDSGWFARISSILLVSLQAVWGGDAAFFGTHAMAGQPLKSSIDLLASGFAGAKDERFVASKEMEAINRALPKQATILRHENQAHLGIGHRTVDDWFQAGIRWSHQPGPEGVHAVMKKYHITHVMWHSGPSFGYDSLGSDLAFYNYTLRHTEGIQSFGGYRVARVPQETPTGSGLSVLYLGCERLYRPGLYRASQLNQVPSVYRTLDGDRSPRPSESLPAEPSAAMALVHKADTLVTDSHCVRVAGLRPVHLGFFEAAKRGHEVLWVRRGPERRPPPQATAHQR